MLDAVDTVARVPTFGIVRLAVPNTRVDCSSYGQSVFADATDAIQSVDLAFDALINEVDAGSWTGRSTARSGTGGEWEVMQ